MGDKVSAVFYQQTVFRRRAQCIFKRFALPGDIENEAVLLQAGSCRLAIGQA